MFRKQYKEDFASIIPDANYVDNLIQKLNDTPNQNRCRRQIPVVAAVLAICLLVGGGFLANYLAEPTFTMMAYAHDNSDTVVNIEESTSVVLPFGKLSRGERDSYIDETGKKMYSYNVGYEHGGISVVGNNIASVTYTSQAGELQFFDSLLAKEMLNERKEDNDNPNSSEKVELIALDNNHLLMQHGKEITTVFHEKLGTKSFDINWVPWHAIDIASEDKPINFADLPADIITIKVSFANGKEITKQLQLSFNSEGDLLAEIITK